jgi:hypothetical protein
VVHKRAAHPSERRTLPTKTLAQRQHVMPQQRQTQGLYTEADVQLAILDLQRKQIKSIRLAEEVYEVPQTTIRRRRDRTRSRRDCEPKSKRLTKLEEEAIVQRILEECLRGIPPSEPSVRSPASCLRGPSGYSALVHACSIDESKVWYCR